MTLCLLTLSVTGFVDTVRDFGLVDIVSNFGFVDIVSDLSPHN